MGHQKRALAVRKQKTAPYATIRSDALLRVVLGHSAIGLRIYLIANAGWIPSPSGKGGRVILPFTAISRPHSSRYPEAQLDAERPGRSQISKGLFELKAAGIILQTKAGTRPNLSGGGRGEASEYDLPDRHGSGTPPIILPSNIRRPRGKVRLKADRIRIDAEALSPSSLRVLYYLVAMQDRSYAGTALVEEINVSRRSLAKLLDSSASGVHNAIGELITKGRLYEISVGKGRGASQYRLAKTYNQFEGAKPPKS